MQFKMPEPSQVQLGLRAMKSLSRSPNQPTRAEREMLDSVQKFFGTNWNIDQLEVIAPQLLAEQLHDPQLRYQLILALCVYCCINMEVRPESAVTVKKFATAFKTKPITLKWLQLLSDNHHIRFRKSLLPKFWAFEHIRYRLKKSGVKTLLEIFLFLLGWPMKPRLARKMRRLKDLPVGTLGRAYYDYMVENGFPFPGERGATYDVIIYHDLAHILGGYGTDPSSEVQIATFVAGLRQKNPEAMIFFVIAQFHLGIQVAPGVKPERGYFDTYKVLCAIRRGAQARRDLSSPEWDFWQDLDRPIEELRQRWNISLP